MTSGRGLKADFAHPGLLRARVHARRGPRSSDLHFGLDNVWRPLALTEPVRDDVRVGRALYRAARPAGRQGRGRGRRCRRPRARAVLPAAGRAARGARRPHGGAAGAARPGRLVAVTVSATHRDARARPSRRSRKSSTALSGACTGHRSSSSPRRRLAPTSTTSFPRTLQPPSWAGRTPRRTRRLPSSSG